MTAKEKILQLWSKGLTPGQIMSRMYGVKYMEVCAVIAEAKKTPMRKIWWT